MNIKKHKQHIKIYTLRSCKFEPRTIRLYKDILQKINAIHNINKLRKTFDYHSREKNHLMNSNLFMILKIFSKLGESPLSDKGHQ
jgi:uncharacterized phage-associated protein